MGCAKALVSFLGRPIIERAIERVARNAAGARGAACVHRVAADAELSGDGWAPTSATG